MCQFLWQRFNLLSGPIFVFFPHVISLCVVCVGYRKFCRLRKGKEILGVLLSDVWPNMMVFRVHENGNGTYCHDTYKGTSGHENGNGASGL